MHRYSYTPTYPTVLTIVHLNGTSILSLYSIEVAFKNISNIRHIDLLELVEPCWLSIMLVYYTLAKVPYILVDNLL
jgi:hypothetical protein